MATKHIALVEWPQDGYAVQALRGILAYAAQHGGWEFRHSVLHAPGLRSLRRDRPDAIIARLDEADERMPELGRLRRPIVNLEGRQWARGVTFVSTDDRMVGRLAGQYFLNRGYRCIAFCAMEGMHFSENREVGLRCALKEAGRDLFGVLRVPSAYGPDNILLDPFASEARRWLVDLPKPCGLVAFNDGAGMSLVAACRRVGLHVPDDVAVLGVDDREVLCSLSCPPLSSIPRPAWRIGHAAAEALARILGGEAAPRDPILIPPLPVVTRQSTDTLAVTDPEVCRSLRFIRRHGAARIGVDDVVAHATICRRALEVRFRRATGRTIRQEIQRVHIDRASRLLAETDLAVAAIAESCGFANAIRLNEAFHRELGCSPSEYREQFRRR